MPVRKVTKNVVIIQFAVLTSRSENIHVRFYIGSGEISLKTEAYFNGALLGTLNDTGKNIDLEFNRLFLNGGINEMAFIFEGDVSDLSLTNLTMF
jgi:hypothetical protein